MAQEELLARGTGSHASSRSYKERDEHGRLPHHWLAAKAQTHTHVLADVGVQSICRNEEALTTRDNKGETPIDIARRSGACAEIMSLLSLTPEEARSLGEKGMLRLYAPGAFWNDVMNKWIKSRSWADCHKFIDEYDDELSWCVKCSNSPIQNSSETCLHQPGVHRLPRVSYSSNDPSTPTFQYR